MTTRTKVDVLFVGHCSHEVSGVLGVCRELDLTSEILEAGSMDDGMKLYDPKLVMIGPLASMKSSRATATKNPGTIFIRRTHTIPGVWDSCEEAGVIASWIKTCEMLSNCRLGSSCRRVHVTLETLDNVVLWPTLYDLPCLEPRCISDGVMRLACGGRSSQMGENLVVVLAVAALRRDHDVELHVWERKGDARSEWLCLLGNSLHVHVCSDGPESFCASLGSESIDVFLQPSISYGFSLSAADALSAGIPVVGTESIEFLPKAWLVRDPGSATEVAERILDLEKLTGDEIHSAQRAFTAFCETRRKEVEATMRNLLSGTAVPDGESK